MLQHPAAKLTCAVTEAYHQFYKGPSALKAEQQALGRIDPTGCPEQGRFWR